MSKKVNPKKITTIFFTVFFTVNTIAQITLPSECVKTQIKEIDDNAYWDLRRFYYIHKFECRMADVFNSFTNKMPDFNTLSYSLSKELEIINQEIKESEKYISEQDKLKWNFIKYWLNQLYLSTKKLNTFISGVSKFSYSSQKDYDNNWMLSILTDIGTYSYKSEKKKEFMSLGKKWKSNGDNLIQTVENYIKITNRVLTSKLQSIFKNFKCVDNMVYEAMVSEKQKKEWFINAIKNIETLYPGYGIDACEQKRLFSLLEKANILGHYKDAMNANFHFSYETSL